MNLKTLGYYILLISLVLLIGSGLYKLLERILFENELALIYKISIIGLILGILFLLGGLIIERIKEEKRWLLPTQKP